MLYDNYKRKILNIGRILAKLIKLLPVIIVVVSTMAVTTVTLVATKGIVGDVSMPSPEIAYGGELDPNASAFMSSANYEYCKVGSNEWSTEIPTEVGEYLVRAYAETSFGGRRYSEAVTFKINPLAVDVYVEANSSFEYGTAPKLTAALPNGDRIDCTAFDYILTGELKTDITPLKEHVTVTDVNGKDVTHCYSFNLLTTSVQVSKKPINVTVEDKNETYNGLSFTFDRYQYGEGELADGDELFATFSPSITDAGEIRDIEPEFAITNAQGKDVTNYYDIKITSGVLTVGQRPLVITLDSTGPAEYTGDPIGFGAEHHVSEDTPMVEGHKVVMTTEQDKFPINAGTHKNPALFSVFAEEEGAEKDVSLNYSIFIEKSDIEIIKRDINVTTSSEKWVYDGESHSSSSVEADDLVKDHKVSASGNIAALTNVGKTENSFSVNITDGTGVDVSSNYEINYIYGTIEIEKRPISFKPQELSVVYDGTAHTSSAIELVNDSDLLSGHSYSVSGNITDPLTNAVTGEYSISDSAVIKIMNGDTDVTENYKIDRSVKGNVKIAKLSLSVAPSGLTKVYDTKPISSDEHTVDGKLLDGHTLTVKEFVSDSANAGEYPWLLEKSDITILDADGKDVTANYELATPEAPVQMKIEKLTVSVKPVDSSFIYNGNLQTSGGGNNVEFFSEDASELKDLNSLFTVVYDPKSSEEDIKAKSGINTNDSAEILIDQDHTEYVILYINEGGEKVDSGNYIVETKPGSFTILPRDITVQPVVGKTIKTYDHDYCYAEGIKWNGVRDENTGLLDGHSVKLKDGEQYKNYIHSDGWDANSEYALNLYLQGDENDPTDDIDGISDIVEFGGDYASNYNVIFDIGETKVEIERRTVRVYVKVEKGKVYDGKPLYATDVFPQDFDPDEQSGLVDDHKIDLILGYNNEYCEFVHTKEVDVGTCTALYVYNDKGEEQEVGYVIDHLITVSGTDAKASNYTFRFDGGSTKNLEITPREVTVTSNLAEKIYDGEAIEYNFVGAEFDEEGKTGLVEGHRIVPIRNDNYNFDSCVDAGKYEVKVSLKYEDYLETGMERAFLAKIHYNDSLNSNGQLELHVFDGDRDITDNYTMVGSKTPDTSKINPRKVTVTPFVEEANRTKIYDHDYGYADRIIGEEWDKENYPNGTTGLLAGHTISLNSDYKKYIRTETVNARPDTPYDLRFFDKGPEISDALPVEKDGLILADIISISGTATKSNYEFVAYSPDPNDNDTKIEINPRPLYVIPTADEKIYDDDYLYATGIEVNPEQGENAGLINGKINGEDIAHTFSINTDSDSYKEYGYFTQIRTEYATAGEHDFVMYLSAGEQLSDLIVFAGEGAMADNYDIIFTKGIKGVIKKRPVIVKVVFTDKAYDGNNIEYNIQALPIEGNPNSGILSRHTFDCSQLRFFDKITRDIGGVGEYKIVFNEDENDADDYAIAYRNNTEISDGNVGVTIINEKVIGAAGNVIDNYAIEYIGSSGTISKRQITFTPTLTYTDTTETGYLYNGDIIQHVLKYKITGDESIEEADILGAGLSWYLAKTNQFSVDVAFYSDRSNVGTYEWRLYDTNDGKNAPDIANSELVKVDEIVIMFNGNEVTHNFAIEYNYDDEAEQKDVSNVLTINPRPIIFKPTLTYTDTTEKGYLYNGDDIGYKFEYQLNPELGYVEDSSWTLSKNNSFSVDVAFEKKYSNVGTYKWVLYHGETAPESVSGIIDDTDRIIIMFNEQNVTHNFAIEYNYNDEAEQKDVSNVLTINPRPITFKPTLTYTDKGYLYNGDNIAYELVYEVTGGDELVKLDGELQRYIEWTLNGNRFNVEYQFKNDCSDVGTYRWLLYHDANNQPYAPSTDKWTEKDPIAIMFGTNNVTGNFSIKYENTNSVIKIEQRPITFKPTLTYTDTGYLYNGDDIGYKFEYRLNSQFIESKNWTLSENNSFSVDVAFEKKYSNVGTYKWVLYHGETAPESVSGIIDDTDRISIMFGTNDVTGNFSIQYYYDLYPFERTNTVTINKRPIRLYPTLNYSDTDGKYNGDEIEYWLEYSIKDYEDPRNPWSTPKKDNSWKLADNKNLFSVDIDFGTGHYSDVGTYEWIFRNDVEDNIEQLYDRDGNITGYIIREKLQIMFNGKDVTDNFDISDPYDELQTIEVEIQKRNVKLNPILGHSNYDETNDRYVYNGTSIKNEIVYEGDGIGNKKADSWMLGVNKNNQFNLSYQHFNNPNAGKYVWSILNGTNSLSYTKIGDVSGSNTPYTPISIILNGRDVTHNFNITYGEDASITVEKRKLIVQPTLTAHPQVYDNDYYYAGGVEQVSATKLQEDPRFYGLVSGHNVNVLLTPDKYNENIMVCEYIRSNGKDAGEHLLSKTTFDYIKDIIVFTGDGASLDNYDVDYYYDHTVKGTIEKRVVWIKPTFDGGVTSFVYDGNQRYSNGIVEDEHGGEEGLLKVSTHGVPHDHIIDQNNVKEFFRTKSANAGNILMVLAGEKKLDHIQIVYNDPTEPSDIDKNYEIKYRGMYVEIKPREITVEPYWNGADNPHPTTYPGDGVYYYLVPEDGGLKLSSISDEKLCSGHKIIYSFGIRSEGMGIGIHSLVTNSGEAQITYGVSIIDNSNNDVTRNYIINYVSGSATVKILPPNQIVVKLDATVSEKTYDGTPIVFDKFFVDGLPDNYTFRHDFTPEEFRSFGELTDKGKLEFYMGDIPDWQSKIHIFDETGQEITEYYTDLDNELLELGTGKLVINERAVRFDPVDKLDVKYDGYEHTLDEVIISSGSLPEGHTFDLGALELQYKCKCCGAYVSNLGFAGYTDAEGKVHMEATVSIISSIIIRNAYGEDVTSNFKVSTYPGRLTIAKQKLFISPKVEFTSKYYDGYAIEASEAKIIDENGEIVDVRYDIIANAITDGVTPGKYNLKFVKADIMLLDANGRDITDNYVITLNSVTVEIKKIPLTVKPIADNKYYDMELLTPSGADVKVNVEKTIYHRYELNSELSSTAKSSNAKPGNYYLRFSSGDLRFFDANGNDITEFCVVDRYESVSVQIKKIPLTVTPIVLSKYYDMTELKPSGAEVAVEIEEGYTTIYDRTLLTSELSLSARSGSSLPDWYYICFETADLIFYTADGRVMPAEGFDITCETVNAEIKAIPLVIRPVVSSKFFDKTELKPTEAVITVDVEEGDTTIYDHYMLASELSSSARSNSIFPGSYDIKFGSDDIKLYTADGTEIPMEGCHIIMSTESAEIWAIPLNLTLIPINETYDGKSITSIYGYSLAALQSMGLLITNTELGKPIDFDIDVIISEIKLINVDESLTDDSVVYQIICKDTQEDVTQGFDVSFTGEVKRVRRYIQIITGSASKKYDGNVLTNHSYLEPVLAEGDRIKQIIFTGENSGDPNSNVTVKNTVDESTIEIVDEYGNDVTQNYDIEVICGDLTVIK